MAEFWLLSVLTLDATLRVATPLIFAAMAGVFTERAGVIDISLEGKMLGAAFAAAAAAHASGNPWVGLLVGIMFSCMMSLLHSFASVTHRGDQVISGLAANMLALGLTATMGIAWYRRGGDTPSLPAEARFLSLELPGAEAIGQIPVLGVVYKELISGHNALVYLSLLAVPLTAWVLFRTRFGMRLRAVGEAPAAADTAGISVAWMRYRAGLCAGILCGFAGTYLSTAHSASFVVNMTAGKGFIALAALIFGKWRPLQAMYACFLFGFFDALAARVQGVKIPGIGELPSDLIAALPYLLTVILLAGFIGKAVAPAAIGVPYVKDN